MGGTFLMANYGTLLLAIDNTDQINILKEIQGEVLEAQIQ